MKQKFVQFPTAKVDIHSTKKHGKTHFKFMGFLNVSGEAEIHKIPKKWEKLIYLVREKYGKTQRLPIFFATSQFRVNDNPCNCQCLGMCKFP